MVFDCDGLLIDSEVRWAVAERRVVEQHGGVWSDELREQLVGGSGEQHRARASPSGSACRRRPRAASCVEVYDSYLAVIDELGVEPMPGARSLVAALAGPPAARGGVQHARAHRARDARGERAAAGLRARLHARSEERRPKPAPDVYLAACDALGVRAGARPSRSRTRRRGSPRRARRACTSIAVPSEGVHEVEADLVLGSLLDLDLAVLGL